MTYTVTGTIGAAFTGTLTNTATVAAPGGVTDPTPGNNSATDTTTVAAPTSVSATKTVSGTFEEGGTIFYSIVISNAGPGAQADNPGNEFTDNLPVGLTLVTASATSGTSSTVGNTVNWNGAIPVLGSVTITIEAVIDAGTTGQTISNQGTVNFDADGNGTNESSVDTDDPTAPGGADPTDIVVGTTPSVVEVPTLSGLGFAMLGLLLAGFALTILRRKRTA